MNNNFALEIKKFCAGRCLYALLHGVGAQFLLLTTYLLFVKFSPFHPIEWLFGTFAAIFSLRTWLCLTPLIGVVVLHAIVLGKSHLAENHFHSTRFGLIVKTFGRQSSLFAIHVAIGFLTAWLYSRFLPKEYTFLYSKCNDGSDDYCLNERFTYIALNGIYTGIFYFVSERLRRPTIVEDFPLVQQPRSNELRFKVTGILYRAVVKQTILPTAAFIIGCAIFGGLILTQVSEIFGFKLAPGYGIFDLFLLTYMFAISSQIISNIALLDFLMNTFLTEYLQFPIENLTTGERMSLTLVDALAAEKTPLVQTLAALDLSTLGSRSNAARRKQVYALSIPGGHPYNWTALSQQSLVMINAFHEELKTTADQCQAATRNGGASISPRFVSANKFGGNSATEMAQTILTRQYNETNGIRNMSTRHLSYEQQTETPEKPDPCRRFNEATEALGQKIEQCKKAFLSLPVINYLFGTDATNRLVYILSTRAPTIEWTVEGLAALVEHSLHEDSYGVVQTDLATIVRTLLQLQTCLEQVAVSFNVQTTSRPRMRCLSLLGTVKRSLCKLATIFGEYLPDLLTDPNHIHTMNAYAQLRQV